MPLVFVEIGPDPGLGWLVLLLLAFLLIVIVVGARVGPAVLAGGAPGALREAEPPAPVSDQHMG